MIQILDLVRKSTLIVVARCDGRVAAGEVGGEPVRVVAVTLERVLCGKTDARRLLVITGPPCDGVRSPPLFRPGERDLLFLRRGPLVEAACSAFALPADDAYELTELNSAFVLEADYRVDLFNNTFRRETGVNPQEHPDAIIGAVGTVCRFAVAREEDRPAILQEIRREDGILGPWLIYQLTQASEEAAYD